jgi:two-component system sensor histidine kinase/response regulator
MDGETLGRKIKEDPDLVGTILVMLTSVGRPGDAARLKEIGFAAYLTEPVKRSQLYNCLATVTGRQGGSKDGLSECIVTRHTIAEDSKCKIRILVVEDNEINQQVALGILEDVGYGADVAANGKEAIKALETIPYDLILMDIQMPEMDGFEATKIIRDPQSRVSSHHVSIIAMTAHAMEGDRDKCIEVGMGLHC